MGPEDDEKGELVSQLIEGIKEVSGLPECRNACRKMYSNLVRRVKLLSPLFEELSDCYDELGDDEVKGLELLKTGLKITKEFLLSLNEGSKIFQVFCLCSCVFMEAILVVN